MRVLINARFGCVAGSLSIKWLKTAWKITGQRTRPTVCDKNFKLHYTHCSKKCFHENKNPTSEHNNSASLPAPCGLLWNCTSDRGNSKAHLPTFLAMIYLLRVPCNKAQAGMNKLCLQAEAPCYAASTGHFIANLFLRWRPTRPSCSSQYYQIKMLALCTPSDKLRI